jgi:hypothetical protein
MGEKRHTYRGLVAKPEGDNLEDPAIDGKTISKLLVSSMGQCGLELSDYVRDKCGLELSMLGTSVDWSCLC